MNGLNYEILDAIDNIEECTYQAEQNVFNSMMAEYQKSMTLLEYVEPDVYDEIIYQEASISQKISNGANKAARILSRLWEGVKRVVGLLISGLKAAINKIVSLFRKTKKTASQVAENVVGSNPQSNTTNSNESIKLSGLSDNKVQMSVDPHSAYKPGPINLPPANGLITKFTDDGSVEISTNCGTEFMNQMVLKNEQKGTGLNSKMLSVRDFSSVVGLHTLLYNDNIKGKFFNMFKQLSEVINMLNNKTVTEEDEEDYAERLSSIINNYNENMLDVCQVIMVRDAKNLSKMNEFNKNFKSKSGEGRISYYNRINAEYNDKYMKPLTFKLKDIQQFSIQLNDLNSKYVQPIKLRENIQLNIKDDTLKTNIQILMNAINEMQYSINLIMNMVSNSFTIDKSYFKTINDPEKLDEFVGALIDAGIPSRYIGYNAWLISGENITSDSEFKPRWGQTRLCLLPNDKDICYKIALSGLGKSGNATEYKVYNELLEKCEALCPCLKLYKTQSVVMSKRAEFINMSQSEKDKIVTDINDEISKLTRNKNIDIEDIHGDNIGIVDGKNVVIDYGEIAWK